MANRKNNYKQYNVRSSPAKIDKEALQSEALLLMTLKNDSEENLLKSSEDFCYLISEKWWDSYEIYLGYKEIIDEKPLKKSFGQRFPGPMNEDIIAEQEKVYKIPIVLEQYQYLSTFIKAKALENESYTLVDEKLWNHVYNLYGGKMIKRPLRHDYSYPCCDDLKKSHILMLTHKKINELAADPNTKKSKMTNILGGFKRMQFHEQWKISDLSIFLNDILEAETGQSNWTIKIWRLNNYVYLDDFWKSFEEFISQFPELDKFLLEAKELTQPRFEDITLMHLLKDDYYLLVEAKDMEEETFYFDEYKLNNQNILDLKGYCENCNEKDFPLKWTCLCQEVFYCSERCKYKDQHFHNHICDRAFDSESDNEEEIKEETNEIFTSDKGLKNLGNTCYMNSVLQAFKRTKIPEDLYYKNDYLKGLKDKKSEDNNKFLLSKKFSKLMKQLSCDGKEPVAPWSLKQTFSYYFPNFKGFHQHDSQEFMAYLFNGLHEEISLNLSQKQSENAPEKQIDYSNPEQLITETIHSSFSRFAELFQGLFSSEIKCPTCGHTSTQYDQYNMVSLPLYNKEDHYNILVTYIPKDINSTFLTKVYKFSHSSTDTLQELLNILKKDLDISNEIPILPAIVEDDMIEEILRDNSLELKELKSKLELKRKKLFAYEMPVDWDSSLDHIVQTCFSSEVKKSNGIAFKKPLGVPRLLVIKSQPIYDDIYLEIMNLLKDEYPDHNTEFLQLKTNLNNQITENPDTNIESNDKVSEIKGEKPESKEKSLIIEKPSNNVTIEKTSNNENDKKNLKNSETNKKPEEEQKNSESQSKEEIPVAEQPKPNPPSKGKGKKNSGPRVSKRKKNNEKSEQNYIKEEPQKPQEKSLEKSPKKELNKKPPDPETLLQDFISNLPYTIKFVNKMRNIHSCLLCGKKNCDSCSINLNNSVTLMNLLDKCLTNQVQMELNIFFRNNYPKSLEQTPQDPYFNNSSVTVNVNPDLIQCIELFSEKEVLSSENMWFCPVCEEKKQAEKTMKLFYVSKYLIFHLKRFKNVEGSNSSKNNKKVKNNQPIDYPINELDMTPYVKDLVPHFRGFIEKNIKYRLISVVLHEGKLDEGHYMALGRCKDGWKKFDDEKVIDISEKEVCHKNAYLLFYELII